MSGIIRGGKPVNLNFKKVVVCQGGFICTDLLFLSHTAGSPLCEANRENQWYVTSPVLWEVWIQRFPTKESTLGSIYFCM